MMLIIFKKYEKLVILFLCNFENIVKIINFCFFFNYILNYFSKLKFKNYLIFIIIFLIVNLKINTI